MEPLELTLSASELHLTAPIGVTTTGSITATNETQVLVGSAPMLDEFAAQFTLAETDCSRSLLPGESCTATIAFTPNRLGVVETLGFGFGSSRVSLTGHGEVALTVSPTEKDFGTIYLDENSELFTFTVQNTTVVSQHPVVRLPVQNGEFLIVDSSCAVIAPMGSCSISVLMQGRLLGGARSFVLDVDGASATLTGNVLNIASPQLEHYGTGYFGDRGIYALHTYTSVAFVNRTHADLALIDVGITGTDAASFSIGMSNCTNPVADGATCYVEVFALPLALGMANAVLSASAPKVPLHSVDLSVNFFDDGPRIAIAPSGVVTFTPNQSIEFTITNSSNYSRSITSVTAPPPYQIFPNNCSGALPTNWYCNFTVRRVGTEDANQPLTIVWNNVQQEMVMLAPAN